MFHRPPSLTLRAAAVSLALNLPCAMADAPVSADPDRAFAQALTSDYQALADAEALQGDERDAANYAARAAAAGAGTPTGPEEIMLREPFLKDRYVDALSAAQERLQSALAGEGRRTAPVAMARAQTSFDCWLEQASEDLQPAEIEACRQSYVLAMETVESSVHPVADSAPTPPEVPAPAVAAAPPGPRSFRVFFDYDSAALSAEAMGLLADIKQEFAASATGRLAVIGHASSAGDEVYNQALSERRATAVKDALVGMSIGSDAISAEGRGEGDQWVSTADGVREPRNRQVFIVLEP